MQGQPALLLVGPTGSGKTPVGERLEATGLAGRRVAHLDFGACLRKIEMRGGGEYNLCDAETAVVLESLRTGALLENESFPIAAKILRAVMLEGGLGPDDLLLLNGLPRHQGQAADVDAIVDLRAVVHLHCTAETVLARIAHNIGGDRTGRTDDGLPAVQRKLATYEQRTLPLLDHYQRRGARMVRVAIAADTSPNDAARAIQQTDWCALGDSRR